MKLSIPREEMHRKVYLLALTLMACCLPLSRYVLSVSQFLLLVNWIIEGRFREKIRIITHKPAIMLFASVFLVYAIGLLNTENLAMGTSKIKNALPLLAFPIIIGTSYPLSVKNTKWILLLFSGAVMAASIICMLNYIINGLPPGGDFRMISIFMLHIRFSLMVVMAILILLYFSIYNYFESTDREKICCFISACLLIAFLFFLRSITGIFIFIILIMVFIANITIRSRRPFIRYVLLSMIIGFFGILTTVVIITYENNFHAAPIQLTALENLTVNGNRYSHNTESRTFENGNYTELYVCEPELKKEWNNTSRIPYDSADRKGQQISETLKRYLTSMGLRKDSVAIHKLSITDMQNIENGITNYQFHEDPGVYQRLYETLWEIHILMNTGFVQQHSLGQRFAFLKAAISVLRNNWWIGVGTGDVYDSMLSVTGSDIPAIDPMWEGKPHNQYLFFMLAFGIIGFLWIALCWFFPIFNAKAYRSLLFNLFAGIILISMFSIDTIESYDNMVFFSYFYCLFVYGTTLQEDKKA